MKPLLLAATLLTALGLAGCGNKGPLILPNLPVGEPPEAVTAAPDADVHEADEFEDIVEPGVPPEDDGVIDEDEPLPAPPPEPVPVPGQAR